MKQLFDDTKTSWGGKRDGAGRPSTGRSKKNLYVTDYEFELLKNVLAAYRMRFLPFLIQKQFHFFRQMRHYRIMQQQ